MNGRILVAFPKEYSTRHHMIRLITEGRIRSVLPVTVVKNGKTVFGIYSAEGMLKLRELELNAHDACEVAGKLLTMIEELKDHLIFPERIVLSPDTIFVRPDLSYTAIALIPETHDIGEKKYVSYLLTTIRRLTGNGGRAYLDVLIEHYEKTREGAAQTRAFVEELKQEIQSFHVE